ncbi:MAG: peptidylprolyl isomerase [Planctomycetes bacterium]|nr:peptidylprolyl isomerase [Planctomycetota bacterium]
MATAEVGMIETTKGTIKVTFFDDVAPGHVTNFKKLAASGFYDGTTFHRVIPGFMIQGGCPHTKSGDRSRHGTGGPGYHLKAEFSKTRHERGILSMARAKDPDSAGSQFFIVVKDCPQLNGQYSVFGRVLEGMEVVDQIVGVPRDARDNPKERVVMNRVQIEKVEL